MPTSPGGGSTAHTELTRPTTKSQVNTFVIHTTGLLNRFAALAERKLETIDKNIARVDIQLKLLESKLSSVDGISEATRSVHPCTTRRRPSPSPLVPRD
jgi:hypothetical protein